MGKALIGLIGLVALFVLVFIILSLVLMVGWNLFAPAALGLPEIKFINAVGGIMIMVLIRQIYARSTPKAVITPAVDPLGKDLTPADRLKLINTITKALNDASTKNVKIE